MTLSRSHTTKAPLTTPEGLESQALQLLLPFLDARENPQRKKLRLVGVRAEKLLRDYQGHESQGSMLF